MALDLMCVCVCARAGLSGMWCVMCDVVLVSAVFIVNICK
jgi:hypothetical protein